MVILIVAYSVVLFDVLLRVVFLVFVLYSSLSIDYELSISKFDTV